MKSIFNKTNKKLIKAFTVLELVVVIVIIGILSTVVYVGYDGVQARARDASVLSDLDTLDGLMTDYALKNNVVGKAIYLESGVTDTDLNFTPSEGNIIDVVIDSSDYCIRGYNNGGTKNSVFNAFTKESSEGVCDSLVPSSLALADYDVSLYLDTGNKESVKGKLSAINWDLWVAGGLGSVVDYNQNGDGNSRIYDVNPWGNQDVVWDVSSQDVASDADGGWNGGYFTIDSSKAYRFSVFVRRKVIGNGLFYLGLHGSPTAVLNKSDSVANTNPYFTARTWWGSANQWYLVTGHVWPAGSGSGSSSLESGIYSMDGTRLFTTGDFIWQSTTTTAHHRTFLYYSTDITTNQQFYHPRVDMIDGTEPTISELLSDVGNTWFDLSGNNNNARLVNNVSYQTTNGGVLKFDGMDDYVNITNQPIQSVAPNNFTVEGFINPDNQNSKIITPQSNGIDQYIGYDPVKQSLHLSVTELADVNNRGFATPDGSVPLNTWTHFAVSINDKNIKIYLNGEKVLESNETVDIAGWSSNWLVGQRGSNTFWYKGMIGRINVYNRELKEDEVRSNFDGQKSRFGL